MNKKSRLRELTADFARHEGRQPRVMVTCRNTDEQDSRIHEVAVLLANFGFNVDLGPAFSNEPDLVSNAIENDVDLLVLVGSETGLPQEMIPVIEDLLTESGRADMIVLEMPQGLTSVELEDRLETSLQNLLRS